ncbi:MAG: transglutaminase family protein, partial [Ectothiorhodospiraceae bacterium]|nr:transglutaminase family protein [Ectothiorhodospiraceae bacterium]
MAITVGIQHHTRYRFDRPVRLSPHDIRLRPAPHARTPLTHYQLRIEPDTHHVHWQQDPFGNHLARVYFPEPMTELVVDVRLHADLTVINPFDFFVEKYAERFPFRYDARLAHDLAPYLEIREHGPLLKRWMQGVDRGSKHIVDFLVMLNQRLKQDIGYTVRMEPGIQSCETTLDEAIGSCRDTGWLLVQILRHLGLAARFVSGYLVQLRPDQESLDGPSGPKEDFTDLHAWAEVYVPGAGWIGLDPTSGLFAGEGHIPLACTPDPVSAAPVTGFSDPCKVEFEFHNKVVRLHEDPRVTYPYDDAQWDAVCRLGRQIDQELEQMDVRLTMGGEPTFISVDDMEGPEWNTEALGVEKRIRAGTLLRRLRDTFSPGGLLLYGQGKWYPGEPLPRWALGCFWHKDGIALWREPALQADERRDYGFRTADAERFMHAVARRLGIPAGHIIPGHEDWLYYLWRDATTPPDVSPVALSWAPQFRDDLCLAMGRGLGAVIGYALPISHDSDSGAWTSGPWRFPRGHLYLVPGASPMGLRLPVAMLPPGPPRTALCVEARNGRLYAFLPPLEQFAAFTALVDAVEATAAELDMPMLLEGFDPPGDPGVNSFKVTPDPGVIEVNIHHSGTWDELERTGTTLYEQARQSRLGTEKFMMDGRHTGTGGGNHVTLGARTTANSPFLRRPDLLRSFLTYWQHHPSLSYLFSGMFIGPTSQAPRVDERGDRFVWLLDQALQLVTPETTPTELDRTLRSCLADLTGHPPR